LFKKTDLILLKKYVSNPEGNVFVVHLPHYITGALFARYSRAETGLRETLLKEFLDENGEIKIGHADDLIERILVQYGDDSVGELEGIHLSLEQISNLATKKIEDKRIGGSPIEQSSRYVFYYQKNENGQFKYLREKKIMQSKFAEEYLSTMEFIFKTYSDLVEPMQEYLKKLKPIEEAEYTIKPNDPKKYKLSELNSEQDIKGFKRAYKFDIRTKACDTIRCILPAATLTNVGLFGNGRFYQGLLTALYSDSIEEMKGLADLAHAELNKFIPNYVKRASSNTYLMETKAKMQSLTRDLLKDLKIKDVEEVMLLQNDPKNYFENLIAQMLYEYSQHPLIQLREFVSHLNEEKQKEIFFIYIGNRKNRRDRPGRALEFGYPFTFDLIGDFGIYRDLHRERMKTQQRQNLTTKLGRTIPDEIGEIGWLEKVEECFERSEALYEKLLPEYPEEAQYVVLFGHRIRWSQGENLREAMHELELRTNPQGHPGYRKMCQQMHSKIKELYPIVAESMKFVDYNDYYWSRAESEARVSRKLDELGMKND